MNDIWKYWVIESDSIVTENDKTIQNFLFILPSAAGGVIYQTKKQRVQSPSKIL